MTDDDWATVVVWETDPEVLLSAEEFCDRRLGKGVVPCKDTPNFIANRIGSFFSATASKIMIEDDYTIEEVDALTGPLIGLPNSASFRLIDIIGLDVWASVGRNVYEGALDDPWRERFLPPAHQVSMAERGWLGEKSGQGFYKRIGKGPNREIHAIDWKTLEYHPAKKASFPTWAGSLQERLRALVNSPDRAGKFLWKLFSDLFRYAAERVPEISDRIIEIDRAMRWGYAHSLGPFELWDALGFRETARRMEDEGRALPAGVQGMLRSGAKSFYRPADARGEPRTEYFDLAGVAYRAIEARLGFLDLEALERARGVVKGNPGASLVDLGDGVLCVEFHDKANVLGENQLSMLEAALEETARNWQAMVIANQGECFCSGADLEALLATAQEGSWDELESMLRRVQAFNMALKYAASPVVTAPFSRTFGGGCTLVLHSTRAQASAELSMGFNEVGSGLIPLGGGTKELLLRLGDTRRAFNLIMTSRTSSSAAEARDLCLLSPADGVSMNPERLIADAKALALGLATGYSPMIPRQDIAVTGDGGDALLEPWIAQQGERLSERDKAIAGKLAFVLSGGRQAGRKQVSEQDLLDLEREAVLSLCGTRT